MRNDNNLKQKIHDLLYGNKTVIKFIYVLIVLNIVALILESYEPFRARHGFGFQVFEIFSIVIFTIEYLARVYVSNIKGTGRRNFAFSFYGVIDLLAILPFYLPFIFTFDLRVIRILRIFKFIRIFKLGRFNRSFKTISAVIKDTKEELIVTLFIAFVLLLISSTLMYYAESVAQPDKFQSIAHSFWWAIATLTTVGYGDVYPVTTFGKFLSSIIALIGIGFVALPTGIISSAFIERIEKNQGKKNVKKCPDCGSKIE